MGLEHFSCRGNLNQKKNVILSINRKAKSRQKRPGSCEEQLRWRGVRRPERHASPLCCQSSTVEHLKIPSAIDTAGYSGHDCFCEHPALCGMRGGPLKRAVWLAPTKNDSAALGVLSTAIRPLRLQHPVQPHPPACAPPLPWPRPSACCGSGGDTLCQTRHRIAPPTAPLPPAGCAETRCPVWKSRPAAAWPRSCARSVSVLNGWPPACFEQNALFLRWSA